jgi:hypothetical protein
VRPEPDPNERTRALPSTTGAARAPELHPIDAVDRVEASLADELAPCRYWLREGRTYGVRCEGATSLEVGADRLSPAWPGLFSWTVRGSVGRATIRGVFEDGQRSGALDVELVARRFDGPRAQLRFVRAIVESIEREELADPFRDRHVEWRASVDYDSRKPPSPRALLDALSRDGLALAAALDAVFAQPARDARTVSARVRLATDAGDVELSELVAADGAWDEDARGVATSKLRGRAPREAWGSTLEWTADCAENRLLRQRLLALLDASSSRSFDAALAESSAAVRASVRSTIDAVRRALEHEPLANALGAVVDGERARAACQRREGYRAALRWIDDVYARSTLRWPTVQRAASLRDAATLYEVYCFFALARAIAAALGTSVRFNAAPSSSALARGATATFGDDRTLRYNSDVAAYSGSLRPDFALVRGGAVELVFDAKMRVRDGHERATDEAARVDLDKMHAYRDALGVRAAVCVFPGERSMLYRTDGTRSADVRLASLVRGKSEGIAALALCPERAL